MRRPSDNLMRMLTQLQLATERDLVACEPAVKRLCQNLPEFDSVWLDALVQRRILTPWQADQLTSSDAEKLRVGDYLKTERIGSKTFHAVSVSTNRHVVLQSLSPTQDSDRQFSELLKRKLERLSEIRASAPASLELPRGILSSDGEYVVSGFVPGWTADELLIRGGRIPWPVVAEIGRQVLDALKWLEDHELIHGELSLRNIKLCANGTATLVSPMTHASAARGVSLTAELRFSDVETMAPERVGTGTPANSCSELYSIGCVLWQLLTARPPFLSADPVNKVLKSQQADVADVRSLVPDCPDWMARILQSMTRRSPELRLNSVAEACQQWQQHAATGTHHVRRLLKRLPDRSRRMSARSNAGSSKREKLASVAAVFAMIVGFAAYGIQSGLLPAPLAVAGSNVSSPDAGIRASENSGTANMTTAEFAELGDTLPARPDGLQAMPQPDAAGVVVLKSRRVYAADPLNFSGIMHIETSDDEMAVVQVAPGEAWKIAADQIGLRNVDIRRTPTSHGGGSSQCQPASNVSATFFLLKHAVSMPVQKVDPPAVCHGPRMRASPRSSPSTTACFLVTDTDCI